MGKEIRFLSVALNIHWKKGQGQELPRRPGIYVEVLWPAHGIRIGQSKNMYNGTRARSDGIAG